MGWMHVITCCDVLSGVITKHEMEEFKTNCMITKHGH